MGRRSTNEIFAVAGTRYRARLMVRLRAGANHRRVADSSGHFVRCSAGGSRGGQITVLIKRNGTNGAVSILIGDYKALPVTARAILFRSLNLLQGIPALLRKEVFLLHEFHSIRFRECFRTRTVEHYVRCFFHPQPRESDRIFYVLPAYNFAGLQCLSIHDGRIHLVCAGAGEYRTAAGVKSRIVLEYGPTRFCCIKTRSAPPQTLVTSAQCPLKPCTIFTLFLWCHVAALNRSGAAVNRESNFLRFHI